MVRRFHPLTDDLVDTRDDMYLHLLHILRASPLQQ